MKIRMTVDSPNGNWNNSAIYEVLKDSIELYKKSRTDKQIYEGKTEWGDECRIEITAV